MHETMNIKFFVLSIHWISIY